MFRFFHSFGNTYTGINERFVLETCGFVRLIKALVKATRMSLPAQLRVIIEQHDVRKLTLTSGIPDSVEELLSVIMERFQLQGNFGLMYQDKDFGKDFFTMTTTADVKDKDTVKLVQIEPTVILNLTTVDESEIKEEFRRITTIRLEETFMSELDGYTPRLLELVRAKGGMAGTKLRPILDAINQSLGIERKRDMVIQSLIEYLGESREELFHDCQVSIALFNLQFSSSSPGALFSLHFG
ncbi:hypothetical protein MHYP_G00320880 [Metynnis hypsauchen]